MSHFNKNTPAAQASPPMGMGQEPPSKAFARHDGMVGDVEYLKRALTNDCNYRVDRSGFDPDEHRVASGSRSPQDVRHTKPWASIAGGETGSSRRFMAMCPEASAKKSSDREPGLTMPSSRGTRPACLQAKQPRIPWRSRQLASKLCNLSSRSLEDLRPIATNNEEGRDNGSNG